jgi:divalent metal cation (Fe/Co/Zn/Cd) transporter
MRFVYRVQKKSAQKYRMPILEYDALLWKTDSYIEILVLINLVVGLILQLVGFRYIGLVIDSGVAIALTFLSLKAPLKGSRDALNQLMDRTVSEDVQMKLLSVVSRNHQNICEFKAIHTRQSGKDIFVELDIILPFDESMKYKDELEKKIANEIKEIAPNAVPRVYAVSCDGKCLCGNQRNCPVHIYRNLNERK